jgi:hypothetical protein
MTSLILDDYSRIEVEPPSSASTVAAASAETKNESDLPV